MHFPVTVLRAKRILVMQPPGFNQEYDLNIVSSAAIDVANGSSLRTKIRRTRLALRDVFYTASSLLALTVSLPPEMQAQGVQAAPSSLQAHGHPSVVLSKARTIPPQTLPKLIVVGFMGGRIRADDFVHREAVLAKDLQQRYPLAVHTAVFANHDGHIALSTVLQLLDSNQDGRLSTEEKDAARIVIYGHSWGASETINLARRLNELGVPVLLTIQVDSVQKANQNDGHIPPNVREAINFYQSEGLLHGRSLIEAADPARTAILGNYESDYRTNPVSCTGYPWYARAFMKPHIEIENDPMVWDRIEALIRAKFLGTPNAAGPSEL